METLTNEDTVAENPADVQEQAVAENPADVQEQAVAENPADVQEQAVAENPAESKEQAESGETVNEEIVFQRIMNYKAYRRGMIMTRALITAAAAVALAFSIRWSIVLGLLLPVTAIIVGAISILVSMGNERSYTVYNTRVVIKRRGDDARKSVPLESIVSVKFKSAFYEKRMCVGTVTVRAKNAKGKVKTYKLKHIFDAKPVVEYLTEATGHQPQ